MLPIRTRSTLILSLNKNDIDKNVDIFICDSVSDKPIPSHVVLAYNGRKRAYGRERLACLEYKEFERLFIQDFQITITEPWVGGTKGSLLDQGFFVTFHRTHGNNDSFMSIDAMSWRELLPNVTKIELEKPEPPKYPWALIFLIVAFFILLVFTIFHEDGKFQRHSAYAKVPKKYPRPPYAYTA